MKKVSQENVLNFAFAEALNKEELLQKKLKHYYGITNNKEIKRLLKDLHKESKEHVKLLMELATNLSIKISGEVVK